MYIGLQSYRPCRMKAFVTMLFISFFLFDACFFFTCEVFLYQLLICFFNSRQSYIQYAVFSIVFYAIKVQTRTNCYKKA